MSEIKTMTAYDDNGGKIIFRDFGKGGDIRAEITIIKSATSVCTTLQFSDEQFKSLRIAIAFFTGSINE